MVLMYYNRTLVQQNKTITRSVGYQGHFVDGTEVLQKALGAAEENNNILTRKVGYQGCFVDDAEVLQQDLGAAEQNKSKKGWLPGAFC